ncbi:MAG: hypothetical protein Fur007_19350 [Rhodoferax sp.]
MNTQRFLQTPQRGVTLIELMVSLAIGLVIALVASVAYMAVRSNATAMDANSQISQDGKMALDLIARDIQMAGFYPGVFTPAQEPVGGRPYYFNPKGTQQPYDQGIFGCDKKIFDPTSAKCTDDSNSDSIVLNYFLAQRKEDLGLNNDIVKKDCLFNNLSNDADNTPLAANGVLFVSNRYAVKTSTYDRASTGSAGNDSTIQVTTGSLMCHGNGGTSYQPILDGVVQLRLRYGVAGTSEAPERYYSASEVSGLGTQDGRTGWQRVTAVQVCLVMQSIVGGVDTPPEGVKRSYQDCDGKTVDIASTDHSVYRTFSRTVAARNYLTGIS